MWKKGILLVVMFLLLLTGCRTPVEPVAPPSFTLETYPKVDGSTVTIPMSEALVSKLLKLPLEEARLYVLHNKTHEAYLNLMAKKADVIFVTSPSAEELDLAKKAGVELEVIPVVSEGFVFLVGADNPVNSLTKKQIVEIYSGKITNWKEVGGKDEPILAYQRPVNSGSQTGFLDLVMKDVTPMEAPTTQVVAGMGELIDAVAAFEDQPGGIGYSYFYYTTSMWKNEKVKLISIEGVAPSKESIASSKYPYRTAYYAVVRKDEPKESNARKLVAYILSKEGQNLMEEAGYVKVK
ncbi:substrate-binding domain-containing protein [Proteiniclasticum sp. BAD-10]|uniref:Substrate-binding domain-containing protein n=1 Tax=Proteiniclasticum sediminis TaxID=2804028 RepID=A0A941CLM1_9CLOT|nr:substrate-binding domain-containing protein [Proteiniclasticum sediminis]MBR0574910.1 substrate-binding domain-containing protein [Proteiniclasticum sediminis]